MGAAAATAHIQLPARIIGAALRASAAVLFVMTALRVGAVDSYGDYPAAWAAATWLGTLGAALGMQVWARTGAGHPAGRPEHSRMD